MSSNLHSRITLPQSSLCEVCQKLDFDSFFFRDGKNWGSHLPIAPLEDYAVYIGRLSDVERRASICGFCQLVTNFEVQKWRSSLHPLAQDANVYITGYNIHLLASRRNDDKDQLLGPGVYVLLTNIGDHLPMSEQEFSGSSSSKTSIQLLEHARLDHSRLIPDCSDEWLLKDYLKLCKCPSSVGRRSARERLSEMVQSWYTEIEYEFKALRVVDVKTRKVIQHSTNGDYAALSYVWGGPPSQRTYLLSSRDVYYHPGSNDSRAVDLPRDLPHTIEDAMKLTQKLGLRYLWVDSLCIVQDDEKQKLEQIRNMHKIFRHAEVCIVAASGDNVHAGIAGVRRGLRTQAQMPRRFKTMTLGLATHSGGDFVNNSVWASRAWTLQEMMLAKRSLIFGSTETAFQCAEHCCRESRGKLQYPGFRDLLQVDINNTNTPLEAYVGIVQRYTKRVLSDKRDILNAFAGFCHAMNHLFPYSFRYGMPLGPDFASSLLWLPIVKSFKRRLTYDEDQKPLFPSWSWAGWEGAVSHSLLDGSMVTVASNISSCISFSNRPDSADLLDPPYLVDSTNEKDLLDFELAPGLVAIWTAKIDLKLEKIDSEQDIESNLGHRSMKVLNDKDEPVGSCLIEEEDRNGENVEFILVATGPTKLMGHEVQDLMVNNWGPEIRWAYVLLVKTVEGLSYRVGIGQVQGQAVDEAVLENVELILA